MKLSKLLDDNLKPMCNRLEYKILIKKCLNYAAPFGTDDGDHVVISPFGVHEMNSPRFREIKSKFMDFLEGLEYGIEDTMLRVKFDSKPIPYSLFSFQFPPARFDMASRLFSSYLTKGDEIIEAYIPGNNNQDSSMVAYFVVKLGSSQNPLNQVFNETVLTEVTVE